MPTSPYYRPRGEDPDWLEKNIKKSSLGIQEWMQAGRERPVLSTADRNIDTWMYSTSMGARLGVPSEAIPKAQQLIADLRVLMGLLNAIASPIPEVNAAKRLFQEILDKDDGGQVRFIVCAAKADSEDAKEFGKRLGGLGVCGMSADLRSVFEGVKKGYEQLKKTIRK